MEKSLEDRISSLEEKVSFLYENLFFECKKCKKVFDKKDHLDDLNNKYCNDCYFKENF